MITAPHPALLAITVVLGVAASGSGDYELSMTWPNGVEMHAPAKSLDTCLEATLGHWQPLGMPPVADAVVRCDPHPGYFAPASNFIDGFNMPAGMR